MKGIKYDDLSEDEWDAKEWDEDGNIPDQVESAAVNKWLFNVDTVDKVLKHLMERGQYVDGGDTLGKTIVFAKNQAHAEFIKERFDLNYPHYKGEFARVVTFKTEYAQSLIESFSIKNKLPQIAISVDMLDTGIDVPEVVNLVFFKLGRSKTKFWQMVGRGTRLGPDLFSPGRDKEFFYIFDYCQNLEYFSQNPEGSDGSLGESLSTRLFKHRSLVGLDREVAKKLFGEFLEGSDYNANQIEFINLVINQLVDHGIVEVSLLYESPFTDVAPQGPDAIFTSEQVDHIMQLLKDIRSAAVAA